MELFTRTEMVDSAWQSCILTASFSTSNVLGILPEELLAGVEDSPMDEPQLLKILKDCGDNVNAASRELFRPTRSMLMPEYEKLAKDLEVLRAARKTATAAWRDYRKSRP
jgi:hypothetical protein